MRDRLDHRRGARLVGALRPHDLRRPPCPSSTDSARSARCRARSRRRHRSATPARCPTPAARCRPAAWSPARRNPTEWAWPTAPALHRPPCRRGPAARARSPALPGNARAIRASRGAPRSAPCSHARHFGWPTNCTGKEEEDRSTKGSAMDMLTKSVVQRLRLPAKVIGWQARRRAYGRLHARDRQQELFVVVAARLADGQDRRHRVRGDRGAARPAGDAADDPQALALGPRAGAAASRARGLGVAGDRANISTT